eukprot:4558855-Pyramimonas_sp.AAC.1
MSASSAPGSPDSAVAEQIVSGARVAFRETTMGAWVTEVTKHETFCVPRAEGTIRCAHWRDLTC